MNFVASQGQGHVLNLSLALGKGSTFDLGSIQFLFASIFFYWIKQTGFTFVTIKPMLFGQRHHEQSTVPSEAF